MKMAELTLLKVEPFNRDSIIIKDSYCIAQNSLYNIFRDNPAHVC